MIHFLPDKFVPAKYQGVRRKYWNECVSIGLLFAGGIFFAGFGHYISGGILSVILAEVRFYIHGVPMCPLCGGTRSFISMCRGDIITALHYSFFGTAVFFIMIFHFVLKFSILIFPESFRLRNIVKNADQHVTLLTLMLGLWGLQMILHYFGIFKWMVIK